MMDGKRAVGMKRVESSIVTGTWKGLRHSSMTRPIVIRRRTFELFQRVIRTHVRYILAKAMVRKGGYSCRTWPQCIGHKTLAYRECRDGARRGFTDPADIVRTKREVPCRVGCVLIKTACEADVPADG